MDTSNRIEELLAENEELRRNIRELNLELMDLNCEISNLERQVEDLEDEAYNETASSTAVEIETHGNYYAERAALHCKRLIESNLHGIEQIEQLFKLQ